MEYESALDKAVELLSWYSEHKQDCNEATTRSHLIDRIVFDCLGWPHESVKMEESYDGNFSDYTLSTARPALIIEAKREGVYFEIPVGKTQIKYRINTLIHGNKELKNAMDQVARYCQPRGIPLGAVCNGHQIVTFFAVRSDGIPPMDGQALVFDSLETIEKEFLSFWKYLSFNGVHENNLLSFLLGVQEPSLPPKLSASISQYPRIKRRNVAQTDLQIVCELVLEDVTRSRDLEPRFLRECYSKSGALSQYALVSRQILAARYAALKQAISDTPSAVPAIEREGVSHELFAESLSRRPILLLGDVGVGKTAFIRNLLLVEGDELVDDGLFLYIDLGSNAALGQDLGSFIISEIKHRLLNEYELDIEKNSFIRGVYNLDVKRFREGIYGPLQDSDPSAYQHKEIEYLENFVLDGREHVRRSVEHIAKAQRQQVIIVIDNADQRTHEIQQEAFLAAQEIAEHWQVTVFIALRIETFYRSQRRGTLSGYHPKAFTIAPPRIDTVIRKRLDFALRLTSGDISVSTLGDDIGINLERLDAIIRIFMESLERNRDLIEFLDNIACGNVRLALDLVRGFLGSGHVNTDKMIQIYEQGGHYQVPLHEFYRAVAYGDHEHFDPNSSPIANLLDLSSVDKKEHFIVPILLSTLHATSGTDSNNGFIESERMYDQLQGIGFVPRQIDHSIRRSIRHKLIESDHSDLENEQYKLPLTIRITTIGAYHIQKLLSRFTYIDTIIVDTPILIKQYRAQITDVREINDRMERVTSFLLYLDKCWEDLKDLDLYFNWENIVINVRRDMTRIKNRIG